MNDELSNIIPKYQEEKIIEKDKGNGKAIFITIIFVLIVAASVFGFIFVYNNYIKDYSPETITSNLEDDVNQLGNTEEDDCSTPEECFYLSALNCKEDEMLIEEKSMYAFMGIIKEDQKIEIQGKNKNEECVIEIKTINSSISNDLEKKIEFIEDDKKFLKVFEQVLWMNEIGNFLDNDFDKIKNPNVELSQEEKEIIRGFAKEIAKEYNSEIDIIYSDELTDEEKEEYIEAINELNETLIENKKNSHQICFFENNLNAKTFLQKKINYRLPKFSYGPENIDYQSKTYTKQKYDEGYCINLQYNNK